MMNKLWSLFIVIGITYGISQNKGVELTELILESASSSVEMILSITPLLCLWLGIMKIAASASLIQKLTKLLGPILKKIFPDIPENHESLGFISSNIIANMLGLGNAATPLGLKAMTSMNELNKKKDTASRSMITFLVINTCGLTIVPTTVISLRMLYKSTNPTSILLACILTTLISTSLALMIDRFIAWRHKSD